MLTCGIIGLALSGKTTIYNLVTGAVAETSQYPSGKTGTNVGAAAVPDQRIDFLADLYHPRKVAYAQIQWSDVPGLVRGASQGGGVGNRFLAGIRDSDLLVHVIRAFTSDGVLHPDGAVDPERDIETIEMELLLSDLELLETRLERLEGSRKQPRDAEVKMELMRRCIASLDQGLPLRQAGLTAAELASLDGSTFLTEKPMIWLVNVDEEQLRTGDYPGRSRVLDLAHERGVECIEVCGLVEAQIRGLAEADRAPFLADLGLQQLGVDRLAQAAYRTLGLISFFTVGEDEVKAWTIHRDTDAQSAAGKIHSDIAKGFIRAEVLRYADLEMWGNAAELRSRGLVHLEGRSYLVQDGDIVNFRFSR